MVPNLDHMAAENLQWFWLKHKGGKKYRDLFPQGGKGSKIATAALANFAGNKATAIKLRLNGEVNTAMFYERIADKIYLELPEWARW